MPSEITVSNLPSAAIWIVAISQLVLALGVIAVLALFGSQAIGILKDVRSMVEDIRRDTMPHVNGTLKNVETISTDAARTTGKATRTADNVIDLANKVVTRMESPTVKVAGLLSGVIAGARAARGKKSEDKEKGGKRGLFRR